jgi:hypothetical protein
LCDWYVSLPGLLPSKCLFRNIIVEENIDLKEGGLITVNEVHMGIKKGIPEDSTFPDIQTEPNDSYTDAPKVAHGLCTGTNVQSVENLEEEDCIKTETEEEFCIQLVRTVKIEDEYSTDLGETVPSVWLRHIKMFLMKEVNSGMTERRRFYNTGGSFGCNVTGSFGC